MCVLIIYRLSSGSRYSGLPAFKNKLYLLISNELRDKSISWFNRDSGTGGQIDKFGGLAALNFITITNTCIR